ncbi:cytochrome c-type biogenesis protein dsbD [Vibrio ishigakensis]|uniref:Thiol:disulfide interchange protein DsbD n=1 Tax=Vibrio ishigakensis TaxID=1481914 RepID=A0A0B8NSP9_9VIBR|nr:protein-disulfide reductase DsbD [Vibrio ishigakensis]GAM55347.1 cytochrome c-type biogenesis protein dsbD [Vibrio ishigakensis]
MRTAFFSILLLLFSSTALASFNAQQQSSFSSASSQPSFGEPTFLKVEQAFPFDYVQQGETVRLTWQVTDGYYLYQERFSVNAENADIGDVQMRQGIPYQDEFFGEVNIYTEPVTLTVPVIAQQGSAKLLVQYQGCAKAGFCYPPETKVIELNPASFGQVSEFVSTQVAPQNTSQESDLASLLEESQWTTPLLFLLLGIGLAFTPCVLPMYPILTSIVLGGGKQSHGRAFALSFVYVQGMALTYTLLGLVVASAGMQFQAALQHPVVLISISVLFIALALSMFGVYTLQLPSSIQTKLNELSNKQSGGKWAGVFAMGAISGLVCSPCTTAPLSGALLYVAQTGDLTTGAITLYALALGMGIPLILVAVFGNKLLPKAGLWMDKVKTLFGFVLLAAPLFFIERLVSGTWMTILWSGLGISFFAWLYHAKNQLEFGSWKQSLVSIVAILGLVGSATPLWTLVSGNHVEIAEAQIAFKRIENAQDLERELALAKEQGKPVMLDFYADWCVACKEFEKYTFHAPQVEEKLKGFVLLQADVTNNRPQDIQLLEKMRVLGLPTIEFWDANGEHLNGARLTGFVKADPFMQHLDKFSL